MYLLPKPLDSFSLLRVKGKGLKQKVLHAGCEWYHSTDRRFLPDVVKIIFRNTFFSRENLYFTCLVTYLNIFCPLKTDQEKPEQRARI